MPAAGTERGFYIEAGGERLYAIAFPCETPVARVLLCGPFPSERLYSLGAWVRWARFLSSNNVLAIRFDYRGTGESTGNFTEMDFHRWREDIFTMCDWAATNYGTGPLVLHGLGMGGLLAQKVFVAQRADALLMWSPPLDTREVLKQGLIARLAMDMALQKPGERKSAQEYFDNLNTGGQIEVDGLTWSSRLWKSSENMALDTLYALAGEGSDRMGGRPWSHVLLGSDVAPLVRSSTLLRAMNPRAAVVPPFPLNPDLSPFFTKNLNWILDNVAEPVRNVHA